MKNYTKTMDNYTNNIKRKIKIYDVEKKELIGEFESTLAASNFAGVNNGAINTYVKSKCRCYKNSLNKIICFR